MNEVAELAKFAMAAGYDLTLEGDDDEELERSEGRPFVVVLQRDEPAWLEEELDWLVYLQAQSSNRSPNDVLDATKARLAEMCATMGLPPMDAPGIGNPPAGGHDH